MECRCGTCSERAKLRLGFFKPKGWIKYKASDDTVIYFCGQECMKKFIFPAELKEKRRLRLLKK